MLPALRSDALAGSVRYFDALTNDARLVIDTLRSAEQHGAVALNYAKFHDASHAGRMWVASVTDTLSERRYEIRARTIVNATGPWADHLPHSAVKLRLSKGIHLVIDRARLPVPSAVVITQGKRILFILPWGDRVILGTTDTDFRAAPETVATEPDDVAYVLRTVNEFFPTLRLAAADIVSTWAGVRPLIANPDGSPSDISRAHQIRCPEPGWWDVAGGKLTTYRLMAEQTVDQIARHVGTSTLPCRTALEPLVPAGDPFSRLVPPACTREAVEHYVRREWAEHLDDVLLRRSSWHYYHRDQSAQAERVATWMAELAGWSPDRRALELAKYHTATGTRQPAIPAVA